MKQLLSFLALLLAVPLFARAQEKPRAETSVHSKKSILRMKTAYIGCAEANFHFEVAICILLS
jgi:hypothetical protein